MTNEEREDAIRFFNEVAEKEVNNAKYSKLAIEALESQAYGDAISRQAVLNTLDKMDKALDTDRTVENYKELLTECYKDLPLIMPTKKEKTGKWIYESLKGQFCSVCDKESFWKFDYCPNCGAKMEVNK